MCSTRVNRSFGLLDTYQRGGFLERCYEDAKGAKRAIRNTRCEELPRPLVSDDFLPKLYCLLRPERLICYRPDARHDRGEKIDYAFKHPR